MAPLSMLGAAPLPTQTTTITMDHLRIVHISDLHCDNTDAWRSAFSYLQKAIIEKRPHLLVITGDCVNQPRASYFDCLEVSLLHLAEQIKQIDQHHQFFIITIAGNHDRYFWGNRLPFLGLRWGVYDKYRARLSYPREFTDYNKFLVQIFKKLGLALFPLDSNKKSRIAFGFARGRLDNPLLQLQEFENLYKEVNPKKYETATKIALLHHHIFPLPSDRVGERLEPYNIMVNAYQFLDATTNLKIDMVLHGHRHESEAMSVSLLTRNSQHLVVCACGTSCKAGEKSHAFNAINLSQHGDCTLTQYNACEKTPNFLPSQPIHLIPYFEVREKRNNQHILFAPRISTQTLRATAKETSSATPPIKCVGMQTKLTTIRESGNSFSRIIYSDIEWDQKGAQHDLFLKHPIYADIGRLIFLNAGLSVDQNPKQHCYSIDTVGKKPKICSSDPEELSFNIKPIGSLDNIKKAHCILNYAVSNAYTVYKYQHEDAYPEYPNDEKTVREEFCAIRANYATPLLRLVIKFESNKLFPDPAGIYVTAFKDRYSVDDEQPVSARYILNREYKKNNFFDSDETTFINHIYALSVYPDMNEILLNIPTPQPKVVYSVHWEVQDDPEEFALDANAKQKLAKSRDFFADPSNRNATIFYETLVERIKLSLSENGLQGILFGYNNDDKCLRVINTPSNLQCSGSLCIGRGVAGKAFKTGESQFFANCDSEDDAFFKELLVVERVAENFNPEFVLSLPLKIPDHFAQRPIAVISIFSDDATSVLSNIRHYYLEDTTEESIEDEAIEKADALISKLDKEIYDVLMNFQQQILTYPGKVNSR